MAGPAQIAPLVFGFESELLNEFARCLREQRYGIIQYLPTRQSKFALPLEPRNLLNVLLHREHLAFSVSLAPGLYRGGLAALAPRLGILYRACFFSESLPRAEMARCFPAALIERGIANGILGSDGGRLQFNVSFVPFGDDLLLRDPHHTYPPSSLSFEGRIWLGPDSVLLATFLKNHLDGRRFRSALEIGSGSGILMLVAARHADRCLAIDLNRRAVEFTRLNAALNGVANVEARYSNLYENVDGRFDLILANPWFCDLASGGLEEVPGIIEGLDDRLDDDGTCVMLVNSYVKRGKDAALEFLREFALNRRYDLAMIVARHDVETDRLTEWVAHGIDYCTLYFVVLRKNGSGLVTRHDRSPLRHFRDMARIRIVRALAK